LHGAKILKTEQSELIDTFENKQNINNPEGLIDA